MATIILKQGANDLEVIAIYDDTVVIELDKDDRLVFVREGRVFGQRAVQTFMPRSGLGLTTATEFVTKEDADAAGAQ